MARTPASLDRMAREGFAVTQGDVSDDQSVKTVMADIERRFARLDALVHCAGIVESEAVASITAELIARQVDVNLIGTMLVNLAALPLLKRNGGSIVNFSSTIVHGPIAGTSIYAATKAGVEAFSRALAFEVGPDRIRVNVVAPSMVEPDLACRGRRRRNLRTNSGEGGRRIPAGPGRRAQDIAGIVQFLVAPGAKWITGTVIPVDGGRSLGAVKRK